MILVNWFGTFFSGIEYLFLEIGDGGGEEGSWEEFLVEKVFIGVFSMFFIFERIDLMVEVEFFLIIFCY